MWTDWSSFCIIIIKRLFMHKFLKRLKVLFGFEQQLLTISTFRWITKPGPALEPCRTGLHHQTFCKLGLRLENIHSQIGNKMFFTVVVTAQQLSVMFITCLEKDVFCLFLTIRMQSSTDGSHLHHASAPQKQTRTQVTGWPTRWRNSRVATLACYHGSTWQPEVCCYSNRRHKLATRHPCNLPRHALRVV